jgi:hypothetical protein
MSVDHSPPPDGLYRELLWVHEMLRRDLQTVQRLSAEARNGGSPAAIEQDIHRLETQGPLWKLRSNCLYYCRFVHGHHTLEDVALFPAVRRRDPSLGPTVDRLEADHLQISGYLDRISASVRELGRDDSPEARNALGDALDSLARHLLEHLSFEEESLRNVLQGMSISDVT